MVGTKGQIQKFNGGISKEKPPNWRNEFFMENTTFALTWKDNQEVRFREEEKRMSIFIHIFYLKAYIPMNLFQIIKE